MEPCKVAISKLFVHSAVDIKDDFEEKYERAYQNLQTITVGLNDKELHDLLSTLICKDEQHEKVSIGLIYQTLTDALLAPKTYRDLTLLTRDGLTLVTNQLSMLVADKYGKFTDIARKQMLWLIRELVKNQVLNVDTILWNIMRQASGGDTSAKNLMLIEGLLDIFIEYRQWLDKFPFLIGNVVYTYVRLIEDHCSPQLVNLRQKEIKFIISLIRDKFVDVMPLGRDFVRLLQNVARVPEFEQLWKDILLNPKSLCPTFMGVWQLLQTRTSRRFLQSRLTPEIERKLHFLTSSVKFGNHKRYQDWFQDKYFTTLESHSLRSDLIRFIINAIHPTNDMLCSDIIPRWAIIGWLLTSCTNTVALANAKLALFYDWLFFDPIKDNIMNVEPGILVMYHSIRNHPLVSATLLDFLCRIMRNFYPKSEDKIRIGVFNSLRKILEKQVIPNLHPLFESPKLDRELRTMIRDNFREFCTNPGDVGGIIGGNIGSGGGVASQFSSIGYDERVSPFTFPHLDDGGRVPAMSVAATQMNAHNNVSGDMPKEVDCGGGGGDSGGDNEIDVGFSDDEEPEVATKNDDLTDDDDDLPLSKVRLKEKPVPDKVDLPTSINDSFEKFVTSSATADFEKFLTSFRTCNTLDAEQESYILENVYTVLKPALPPNQNGIFPDSKSCEKQLADSVTGPLFSLFRIIHQYEEKCKKCILNFFGSLANRLPCIGYLLLYFLKVHTKMQARKNPNNANVIYKTNVYKIMCDTIGDKLDERLAKDLCALEMESVPMFLWILPEMYREFKSVMINNSDVLRIVVGCVDARNLRDIIYNVTQGKLIILKKEGILDCIREALTYETFEQICVWQLIQAHDVPIECLQDIIPELESSQHSEALTNMLMLLKTERPNNEIVRLLLSRETKSRGDPFVTSALRYWCQEFEEKLSEIIASLLTSKYPHSSPNKRKRPVKNSFVQNSSPSSDQLLCHLEHFRRSCRHGNGTGTGLYVQDTMQRALQQAFLHSTETIKKQYSDLFALAAEDETSGVGRRGTSGRGRKPPPNKKDTNNVTNASNNKKLAEPINNMYSSDDQSSDEDWSKPKAAKRKKKTISDSE